ncbi:MAG: hypothetical protein GF364_11435 [Candidatus Lokiarchaeota archaeon]|nr:hypothetical protein [Candidatus Lokiarchaeota archaeon]
MIKISENSEKIVSPDESIKKRKSLRNLGIIIAISFTAFWTILGLFQWIPSGVSAEDYDYIYLIFMCGAGIITVFHLWCRYPGFPEDSPLRRLFKLMGFTFFPLIIIFTIQLIDTVLQWNGLSTIFGTINSIVGTIKFDFFGIEQFGTTMPGDSLVIFEIIVFSIIFYIYPMEVFTGKKRWRIYILIGFLVLIPLAPFIAEAFNEMIISIVTAAIIIYVVYCFLYLFYLYFSTARKSTGSMRKGGYLVAFGLLFLILTWIVGWALPAMGDMPNALRTFIQYTVGITAVLIYNWGFYILRPIT